MVLSMRNLIPISKTEFPTSPVCYPFDDSGLIFSWGNFWLQLQKNPLPIYAQKTSDSPLKYLYSLSVFERRDINPKASLLPVAIATLEQMNVEHPNNKQIVEILGKNPPIMIGLFFNGHRYNCGELSVDILPESEISSFLGEVIADYINFTGEQKYIGNIEQAYGHPDTGLPKKEKKKGFFTKLFGL